VVKYKQEFAIHGNNESSNMHPVLPNNFTLQNRCLCYFFICWYIESPCCKLYM